MDLKPIKSENSLLSIVLNLTERISHIVGLKDILSEYWAFDSNIGKRIYKVNDLNQKYGKRTIEIIRDQSYAILKYPTYCSCGKPIEVFHHPKHLEEYYKLTTNEKSVWFFLKKGIEGYSAEKFYKQERTIKSKQPRFYPSYINLSKYCFDCKEDRYFRIEKILQHYKIVGCKEIYPLMDECEITFNQSDYSNDLIDIPQTSIQSIDNDTDIIDLKSFSYQEQDIIIKFSQLDEDENRLKKFIGCTDLHKNSTIKKLLKLGGLVVESGKYTINYQLKEYLKGQHPESGILPILSNKIVKELYKALLLKYQFVFPEIPYCKFINMEYLTSTGFLPKEQQPYFLRCHCDFLITDRLTNPIKVIEVNGGYHFTDAKTIEKDKQKKSFCDSVNLPIEFLSYQEAINTYLPNFNIYSL
ncbi:MAG: DUF2726 domain-containing protein [Cytophagaceae bacterium]